MIVFQNKILFGHGTFLASVTCGSGSGEIQSVAPEAEIIAVKLKRAREYYYERLLIPEEIETVYQTTDLMLGIEYIIEKARELNMPVSICIGVGTNHGGHDGFTEIERYISTVSNMTGVCISTAARK